MTCESEEQAIRHTKTRKYKYYYDRRMDGGLRNTTHGANSRHNNKQNPRLQKSFEHHVHPNGYTCEVTVDMVNNSEASDSADSDVAGPFELGTSGADTAG